MYMGFNKIDINILCYRCRSKMTDVQGMTIEELYNFWYTDPRWAHKRNQHRELNAIIVQTLLNNHDSCGCLTKVYEFG